MSGFNLIKRLWQDLRPYWRAMGLAIALWAIAGLGLTIFAYKQKQQLHEQQLLIAQIQQSLQQLGPDTTAGRTAPLTLADLNQAPNQLGLNPQQVEVATHNDTTTVTIASVEFSRWLQWYAGLALSHDLKVKHLEINRLSDHPGWVSVVLECESVH
jgi:type II secretory pathway component PulM